MTTLLPDPMTLPAKRSCPFDPPDEYAWLLAERPISRLQLPGGQIGWLVTRYEDVRATLADQRFSPPLVQVTPAAELPLPNEELVVPPGTFPALDPPEHSRYRRLVSPYFTRKAMRELTPRIREIVDEHLSAFIAQGDRGDLVTGFAGPMASSVIGEMVGVPVADRPAFQRQVATLLSLSAGVDELRDARLGLYGSMAELVAAKRRRPGDDIISRLLQGETRISDTEVVNIAALLLLTGLETTAGMVGLGAFVLLEHPGQLADLKADETLIDGAIEELLRYLSIVQFGVTRKAKEDLEIGGQVIHAGETVIASIAAANRDPRFLSDPDRLDIHRSGTPHIAFGYGVHQCLGAHLARTEMKVALTALFRRLPTLRLAVPAEEIPMADDTVLYCVHSLPVVWDD
ncbi:cytochrome P450 [Actinoallomurus liliacearum]|uniref:Cytochrome P450 n=1 Tax=Actinoallomurus liliacearum TaxID=1080073 RepID=A0ABP8TR78_9ACTN